MTATYRKDSFLETTLELKAVGKDSAVARPGQSLSAACNPAAAGLETFPVTAASLQVSPMALSMSLIGTMETGSACPGTQMVGNVTCYLR